jgi:hypothetical protein
MCLRHGKKMRLASSAGQSIQKNAAGYSTLPSPFHNVPLYPR